MQTARFWILIMIAISSLPLKAESFEIVDGGAAVTGKPNGSSNQARDNWQAACDQWKSETKELNKNNEILNLSCESPACDWQSGNYTCTSHAVYKLKISGTFAQPPPPSAPIVTETVVATPPPPVIVESVPAPRPGFLWIAGYWGWFGQRHIWYPGHWEHDRPGFVWVRPTWVAHGHGWRFERGHWRR